MIRYYLALQGAEKGLSGNDIFLSDPPKKTSPAEFRAFWHGLFCGRYLFPCWPPYFRAQNSLAAYFGSTLFLCSFLLSFPFEFMYFIMQKTVIFIYISANRIQHKFLVYFFCRSIIKTAKFFVFFYVSKVPFCLY